MSKPRINRHAFAFMVPQPLWEQLQAALEVTRRSATAEMTLALEERLAFLEATFVTMPVQEKRERDVQLAKAGDSPHW